jgi:hypothetical protein
MIHKFFVIGLIASLSLLIAAACSEDDGNPAGGTNAADIEWVGSYASITFTLLTKADNTPLQMTVTGIDNPVVFDSLMIAPQSDPSAGVVGGKHPNATFLWMYGLSESQMHGFIYYTYNEVPIFDNEQLTLYKQ